MYINIINQYHVHGLSSSIARLISFVWYFNPKQARGGICSQAGSSLSCAETVSSRKPKLSDFYYILIGLSSEYKPVPWDIL